MELFSHGHTDVGEVGEAEAARTDPLQGAATSSTSPDCDQRRAARSEERRMCTVGSGVAAASSRNAFLNREDQPGYVGDGARHMPNERYAIHRTREELQRGLFASCLHVVRTVFGQFVERVFEKNSL